jgi:hypothetical protein
VKLHRVRLELRPARADAWPLREIKDWDVMRGFVPPLEQVRLPHERLSVSIDLLPVAPRRMVPERHRILTSIRQGEVQDPLVAITGRSDWVLPAQNVERQVERSGLLAKVGRSDPFFEVQVLISAVSPDREHARELVERAYAAFEQFTGQNYLRAVGRPVLGTWFWGSDALWRRGWFDLRERTGLFGGRRLLTTRELAGLLKPWTRHCTAPSIVRREREELQPPERAASTGMGVCLAADGRVVALAPRDARYHAHVLGPIGKGKSTLLASMALDRIEAGLASVVIDPSKGDLVRELLPCIPERHWPSVIVLDPALGRERPVGLNVLECSDPEQHELIADQVTFIFRRLFERWWGPRTDHVLRAALLTLLRNQGTTLCDVPALLADADARRRWTANLHDPLGLDLFWREFERYSDSERERNVGPLLYKLQSVLMRSSVRNILGQSRSTIDLEHVLDGAGTLLVSLPRGELGPETSSLFGSLLVARLWQVAQGRSRRPEAERPDACLLLDECHRLLHLPQTMEEILIEARGYHLGLVLAHQHLSQLPASMLAAVGANVHTRVAFQCEQDATQLAGWFAPLGARELESLEQFQVAVRLCVDGHSEAPFLGRTRPPAPSLGEEHGARLLAASLGRWGRPRAEVEAEILSRYRSLPVDDQEDEQWA